MILFGAINSNDERKAGVRDEKPRRIRSRKSLGNRYVDTSIILKCISKKYLVKTYKEELRNTDFVRAAMNLRGFL